MRQRVTGVAVAAAAFVVAVSGCSVHRPDGGAVFAAPVSGTSAPGAQVDEALSALEELAVKGRAPKTGYARSEFGIAWTDTNTVMWGGNSLSTREDILSRDLVDITCKDRSGVASPPCVVQSGVLHDPYTGTTVNFVRGETTSPLVPIEHVVALGDSWQKGAQQLSVAERVDLANDPLNLIATTQAPNSAKSDSDAASWLPSEQGVPMCLCGSSGRGQTPVSVVGDQCGERRDRRGLVDVSRPGASLQCRGGRSCFVNER